MVWSSYCCGQQHSSLSVCFPIPLQRQEKEQQRYPQEKDEMGRGQSVRSSLSWPTCLGSESRRRKGLRVILVMVSPVGPDPELFVWSVGTVGLWLCAITVGAAGLRDTQGSLCLWAGGLVLLWVNTDKTAKLLSPLAEVQAAGRMQPSGGAPSWVEEWQNPVSTWARPHQWVYPCPILWNYIGHAGDVVGDSPF